MPAPCNSYGALIGPGPILCLYPAARCACGPVAFARTEIRMLDFVMIALVVVFLVGCVAYTLVCERL
jgi:hypothetical protein